MNRFVQPVITCLSFAFIAMGCGGSSDQKPEGLIPMGTMSDMLYDIAILEAIDNNYRGSLERNDISIMETVYDKYGVDSLRFASSDLYYASQPALYEQIYQQVEDRLTHERDSIGEVIKAGNEAGRSSVNQDKEADSLQSVEPQD